MLNSLLADMAVPNVHPLVVHFPIALLLTATLFDVACLFSRGRRWLDFTAAALYVLGTVGAALAWWTGGQAAAEMWSMPGAAQAAMADHGSLGLLTLLAFLGVTVLRLIVTRLGRRDEKIRVGFFRLAALAAAFGAQALLVVTADHGGTLVYHHGMGVQTVQAPDKED